MKVTVSYFGQVRQIVGKDSEVSECDESVGLSELVRDLGNRYGGDFQAIVVDEAGQLRPSLLTLVNGQAVDKGSGVQLRDGDEVTLLPPIAGG